MAAPGGWPPQDQWGQQPPQPPPATGRSRGWIVGLSIAGVLLLLLGTVGVVLLVTGDDDAGASEVFLEPASSTGPDPFTASVATQPVSTTTSSTPPTTAEPGGITSMGGGEPGLYGGTRDTGSCDPDKLVAFLKENPAKAAAWASVLGIPVGEIGSYVASLTPVVLRTDTRVTNHGFRDGSPTTLPAVLQAGTAVLVDDHGQPVVKCACGNPLTAPTPVSRPRYTGPEWPGFSPTTIVVISRSTTVITEFVLTGPDGERFTRPAGTSGGDDGPAPGSTSTTTSPPSSTTTSAPTSTSTTSSTSTTTRPPSTTATTAPPTGPTTLTGATSIDGQGIVGTQNWTASLRVAADGTVSGTGSGTLIGEGTCLDGGGDLLSTFTATVSFEVSISGTADGAVLSGRATAPSGRLDSVVYVPEVPGNEVCRAEAQSTYLSFVNQSMGSFSVALSSGAQAPLQATFPGTVTLR